MTKEEAFKILGLTATATEEEIENTYRDLVAKLEAEHGESSYLADKVTQARDLLLDL